MTVEFTAVYREVPEGLVAFVEELPGANTQGAILDEARENLREAVTLLLETNGDLAQEDLAGTTVIREPFRLSAQPPRRETRRPHSAFGSAWLPLPCACASTMICAFASTAPTPV